MIYWQRETGPLSFQLAYPASERRLSDIRGPAGLSYRVAQIKYQTGSFAFEFSGKGMSFSDHETLLVMMVIIRSEWLS